MSEYISKQEAIKIADSYMSEDAMDIREEITLLPTADVIPKEKYDKLLKNATILAEEEIVRCKDCKNHGKFMGWCGTSKPDDYCSYGERKENEQIH